MSSGTSTVDRGKCAACGADAGESADPCAPSRAGLWPRTWSRRSRAAGCRFTDRARVPQTQRPRPSRLIRHITAASRVCQESGLRTSSGAPMRLRRRNRHGGHGCVGAWSAGIRISMRPSSRRSARPCGTHRPCDSGCPGGYDRAGGGHMSASLTPVLRSSGRAGRRSGRGAVRLWWGRLRLRPRTGEGRYRSMAANCTSCAVMGLSPSRTPTVRCSGLTQRLHADPGTSRFASSATCATIQLSSVTGERDASAPEEADPRPTPCRKASIRSFA